MTADTRATAWNVAQGVAAALLIAACFAGARLHATEIIIPDPCKVCFEIWPDWWCRWNGCDQPPAGGGQ